MDTLSPGAKLAVLFSPCVTTAVLTFSCVAVSQMSSAATRPTRTARMMSMILSGFFMGQFPPQGAVYHNLPHHANTFLT